MHKRIRLLSKGGLQAVAELLQVDCEMFGLTSDHYSITLRRYAGMALTNLTFGDVANKVGGNENLTHECSADASSSSTESVGFFRRHCAP